MIRSFTNRLEFLHTHYKKNRIQGFLEGANTFEERKEYNGVLSQFILEVLENIWYDIQTLVFLAISITGIVFFK
jgi:hypothetical protein